MPHQSRSAAQRDSIARGGYVLADAEDPELILIASGSEVGLAVDAAEAMSDSKVRVVSMPSTCRFDAQDQAYKDSVLTPGVKRVAIEAGVDLGWHKYVGLDGDVVCMKSFGESAPAGQLFEQFGFTVDNVVATAKKVMG